MNKMTLSRERQLVLAGSVEVGKEKCETFIQMMNENLDWSDILFQLVTHRTLNMFFHNLQKYKLTSLLEKELYRLMVSESKVYYERNRFYLKVLSEVFSEFEKHHLVVPILKGNLLASKVYPSIETRGFNDLDLLIKPDDILAVTKALENLGYIQGHLDEEKKRIVEASRKEKMLQQMTSHELQEFQMLSENPFAPLIQIDVNHNILWKGNCPWTIDTADFIHRALPIKIGGAKGYMLDYIDNIIQLSSHLYKEATLMMWITDLRDLKIYKFSDLYMYIRRYYENIDWDQLVERVSGYGIQKIVFYNFHYIELMFGEIIPPDVNKALKPDDLTYLNEYGIENKAPSVWDYDFFTRLFDTNRVLQIKREQYSNMSRYLDAKEKTGGVFHHRVNPS